jgi:hypothetical protein
MSETCSFRGGANFDALISRYRGKLYPKTARFRAFPKNPFHRRAAAICGQAMLREYPFTGATNAGTRCKFDLPLDRPLKA